MPAVSTVAKFAAKGKKGKIAKIAISAIPIIIILLILACVGLFLLPIVVLAAIDYGLQDSLGFSDTSAILEEQAEHITAEQLKSGKIRSDYANDLAQAGLLVGQVTASGEFVRTDVYIADLGLPKEVASTDIEIHKRDDGELAIMFNNEIITADNFVASVESNPKMYAAYSKALNISARYYYSSEVEAVYKRFGLSRNNFSTWNTTGDIATDEKNFYEIVEKVLAANTNISISGYDLSSEGGEDDSDYNFTYQVSNNNAKALLNGVSGQIKSTTTEDATGRAATLLNVAVSSSEPYTAAKSFILVEEAIQRARIDGDGPVNVVMNVLSKPTEVEVFDVESGKDKVVNKSILGTDNFVAAFSEPSFSKVDALNYSRDRIINTVGGVGTDSINETAVAADNSSQFSFLAIITGREDANANAILKNKTTIENTFYKKPSTTFGSSVGANRIVEGGSFLSNLINLNVLGAMPSDASQIASYQQEVEEVLARRAEADRATLSPFDISSPNTMFGGITRKIAGIYARNSSSTFPMLATVGDLLSNSFTSLVNPSANADGEKRFSSINGECPTANSIGVEGDLYCNTHNTVDISHMSYTLEDYKKSAIGDSLNSDGSIKDNSPLAQFIALGMGREVTVGVESADTCERWKDFPGNQGLFGKIGDLLSDLLGLYESCRGVDSDVATGANYILSSNNGDLENVKLYSSYIMYQMVSSLISDSKNQVTAYKERYYAEHPFVNETEIAKTRTNE